MRQVKLACSVDGQIVVIIVSLGNYSEHSIDSMRDVFVLIHKR